MLKWSAQNYLIIIIITFLCCVRERSQYVNFERFMRERERGIFLWRSLTIENMYCLLQKDFLWSTTSWSIVSSALQGSVNDPLILKFTEKSLKNNWIIILIIVNSSVKNCFFSLENISYSVYFNNPRIAYYHTVSSSWAY